MESNYHIGAQILSPEMFECCFKSKDAILAQINSFRETAAQGSKDFSNMIQHNSQDCLAEMSKYNNTISILGSRGTGKTSIIMTLRHILDPESGKDTERYGENGNQNNIILPMLVPQDFAQGQPLLGWVINQLVKKVDEIEGEIQVNGSFVAWQRIWSEGNDLFPSAESPLRKCADELLSAFDLRFRSQNTQIIQRVSTDQVFYYMDSLRQDSNLSQCFLKLVSLIIDYYRHKRGPDYASSSSNSNDYEREPLLIFTIDDLDLAPERSGEVVDLILHYLHHPNIVVLCGWYHELFQNNLSIEILKSQGVLSTNQLNECFGFDDVFMQRARKRVTALDSARRLASDNLKKAFPPAQRYEIRSLSIDERSDFPYKVDARTQESVKQKRLFAVIEQAMLRMTHRPYKQSDRVSFLRDNSGELSVYMRIFDSKARGLGNIYKAFLLLIEKHSGLNIKEQKDDWDDITVDLKNLLDTILFSNTHFRPFMRGIRDLIQIDMVKVGRKRELSYYCNFKAIKSTLDAYWKELSNFDRVRGDDPYKDPHKLEQMYDYFPSVVVDVYILLNFMENMLRFLADKRASNHGGLDFCNLLNTLHPPVVFSPSDHWSLTQALYIGDVELFRFFPNISDFTLALSILNSYEKLGFERKQYHFTGFDCLYGIFSMACDHFTVPLSGRNNILFYDPNLTSAGRKLVAKNTRTILTSDPEWLASIRQLLLAIRFTEKNIARLAIYSSMLDATGYDEDLAKRITEESMAVSFSKFKGKNLKYCYSDFRFQGANNYELDILVKCLRLIANNRDRFIDLWQKGRGQIPTPIGGQGSSTRTSYLRALAVMSIEFPDSVSRTYRNKSCAPLAPVITEPQKFQNLLSPIDPFSEKNVSISSDALIDFEKVNKALEVSNQIIDILLHDIKAHLLVSFYKNLFLLFDDKIRVFDDKTYDVSEEKEHKPLGDIIGLSSLEQLRMTMNYLQKSSLAIRSYVEHWQLLFGSWGEREIRASADLISTFQQNYRPDLVEYVDSLSKIGYKLSTQNREKYMSRLRELMFYINSEINLFDKSDRAIIKRGLNVLSDFPNKVTRELSSEYFLYNALMSVGSEIAQMRSIIALAIDRYQDDKSDPEAQLMAWPVTKHYKDFLNETSLRLGVAEEAEHRDSNFTFFSSALSDISLIAQIRVK